MDFEQSIKIAVIGGGEAVKQLCHWPRLGSEVCSNLQLELFDLATRLSPGSSSRSLEELDTSAFDLIVDLREDREAALSGAGIDTQRVVSGANAKVVASLLDQMQKVCEEREIQKGIIDSATDAIITINEDHIIVGYNQGAEKILGYTREEALGQDLEIIIPPPYKQEHKGYVRRYLATRKAHVIGKHVRLKAQRRDGQEFPISISFSVAEIGGHLYFTGIIRDITESMKLEAKLHQSERLAAVGNTVSHIIHEIKNPLTIIGGFSQQLQRAPTLDEKGRQKLAMIADEVKRLEYLVAEMKDFSHPPTLQKTYGRIEKVIEEIQALYDDILKDQGIVLHLMLCESAPAVSFDPQQIKQVLINLVKNAVEAMPRGGQLTLATRLQKPYLEIEVTDTGEGIAPEVAKNIFNPYYSTKAKGSGLGLAISRNIIQAHGGDILVRSSPGQGSSFMIHLPLKEETAAD